MKFSKLLFITVFSAAAGLSFSVFSADDIVTNSSAVKIQEPHDEISSLYAIQDFEEANKKGLTPKVLERCSPTIFTRYTSVKSGAKEVIASFNYDGGKCNKYGFAILRNYEGHKFSVTLVDSDGKKVAGGYSVAVSTSIFKTGTYYWEVLNKNTSNSNSYGGISYEVRSKG